MRKTENYYEFVDKFCERRGITDKDIIQELYLTVAEILSDKSANKEYGHIYGRIANKAEKLLNAKNDEATLFADLDFDIAYSIDKTIEYDILKNVLSDVLNTLTEREQLVLKLRFDDNLTYERIGKIIGTERTRPMQIEHKALRKLRHPSRRCKLVHFIVED